MNFLSRLFGDKQGRIALVPLYEAVVAEGRDPAWYREGGVPDTIDGRFDVIAAVLSIVLLRIEAEGPAGRSDSVHLAELFVDDMEATLREIGVGDMVVGKRLRKLMGALGGRLGAYRRALSGEEALEGAVRRNLFRDSPPSEPALAYAADRLRRLHSALLETAYDDVRAGRLKRP